MEKIRREEFSPGMFIHKFGTGTFDDPDVFVDEPVMSVAEFDALVPAYIAEIIVDPDKFEAVSVQVVTEPEPEHEISTSFEEELEHMDNLYKEALYEMKDMFGDIRKGRSFDFYAPSELALDMVDSVFRNEHAAIAATKIRRFDDYLLTHSLNVSILSVVLGKYVGLSVDDLSSLAMAGLFHDIGKCRIAPSILNKPSKLTDEEFRIVKRHPFESFALLRRQKDVSEDILKGVLHHHERYDGSGYPYGLIDSEISIFAGILGLVDVYDAMTSRKGYGTTIAPAAALRKMFSSMTNSFPVDQVEELVGCMGVYPPGSMVRLKDGRFAVVIERGKNSSIRPVVKIIMDMALSPIRQEVIDLSECCDVAGSPELLSYVNPDKYGIDISHYLK